MFRLVLALSVVLVSVSQVEARPHPRPPKRWHLQPANVTTSTLATAKQLIRDHRVFPVRVFTIFTANIRDTQAAGTEGSLDIRYSNGADYDGRDAYGTIRNVGINRCLTNLNNYTGSQDTNVLRWETCQPSTAGLAYRRQLFLIAKNQHNLIRVQSDLQYVMQVPNAKSECLRQVTPTEVRTEICNGLHNWMLR